MRVKIFCPLWGSEDMPVTQFFSRVKDAGYDGVDAWLPADKDTRHHFIHELQRYELELISHQHQAAGKTIDEFLESYQYYLSISAEGNPVLINSHSGKDYFSFEDQLKVLDKAAEFSRKNGIRVVHETHRGRIGYCPSSAGQLFKVRPEMRITADFSHWVCVAENLYLEGYEDVLEEAIRRTDHIHARIGFTEGPQVSDPRSAEWEEEKSVFLGWWDSIVSVREAAGADQLTFTPEFGPYPYMWQIPFTRQEVANQWEVNYYIKELLRKRYFNP